MEGSALALWGITMLVGAYMFAMAMGMGRDIGDVARSHWPTWLMFVHASLAIAGAAVYVVYMSTHESVYAWVAFGDLVLVAGLGDVLFATWFKDRRAVRRAQRKGRTATATDHTPVNLKPSKPGQRVVQAEIDTEVAVTDFEERRIPVIAVTTHGLTAVLTLVLVLLSALGVGS